MSRDYEISITTPYGECQLAADSVGEFADLARVVASVLNKKSGGDLETMAEEALGKLQAYTYATRKKLAPTNIAKAGLELVVVQCYLRDMEIAEAVSYLSDRHNFKASMTAVGRYWRDLYTLGILPVNSVLKDD